jgi:hypothetical protein
MTSTPGAQGYDSSGDPGRHHQSAHGHSLDGVVAIGQTERLPSSDAGETAPKERPGPPH